MQTNSMRLIHSVIILLFLIMTAGISAADEINVELVSHFGGEVSDAVIDGNYAYIGQGQDFVVLDITDISTPSEVGRVTISSWVYDIAMSGNFAYIANGNGTIVIVEVSDLSAPTFVGSYVAPDYVESVAASGNYIYIANGYSGLSILSISNPSMPVLTGTCGTGDYARNIDISGNYAYVTDDTNGLVIIDITNPSAPTAVSNYSIDGYIDGIAVSNNYAYITGNNGLYILDVTVPSSPKLVGNYDAEGAYGVAVSGSYAYVADSYNSNLLILDITDPTLPILTGTFDIEGDYSYEVTISDNYAYIVDDYLGLVIVDISDPSTPTLAGSYVAVSVNDVVVSDNYGYITNDYGLFIVDVTDLSSPLLISTYDTGLNTKAVAVSDNHAYVTSDYGLSVVDISNPFSPTLAGTYDYTDVFSAYSKGIAISGNYAYIPGRHGLIIVDISNPESPTFTGNYDTIGQALDVAVLGNYAYLVDYWNGLVVVDISDPSEPTLVGSYVTNGSASGVAVTSNYAYIATSNGLVIVDISNPVSPILAASYNVAGGAEGVTILDNYAYVAANINGLDILDITDPSSPIHAGGYDTAYANNVAVSGNYAYVADSGNGIIILRTGTASDTTPTAPVMGLQETGVGSDWIKWTWENPYDSDFSHVMVYIDGAFVGNIFDWSYNSTGLTEGIHTISTKTVDANGNINPTWINDSARTATVNVDLVSKFEEEGISDVVLDGDYAYVAGFDSGFGIVDIKAPSSPKLVGTYSGPAAEIAVSDNYAYVISNMYSTDEYYSQFEIIDLSDPSSPSVIGNYSSGALLSDIAIAGNYAYVTCSVYSAEQSYGQLEIVNISDPSSPVLVGTYYTYREDTEHVAISGNYAYVTSGFYLTDNIYGQLEIVDISNPSSPALVGSYDIVGGTIDIAVSGNYVYIVNGNNNLEIVNISNPSSPTLACMYDTADYTWGVAVEGNYAYIASDYNGLFIVDISDPLSPMLAGIYDIEGYANDVAVKGKYVYVADGDNGLVILRVGPVPDTRPPASVADLEESDSDSSWINWTWTNPTNPDFSHVMVYIDGAFVRNTSGNLTNYYNATGLAEGITYTIGIQTVDTSGNINSTQVIDSATAVKLPKISSLSGTNITTSSITMVWEASNDTSKVEIHRNDLVLGNVSGSTTYVDSNLSSGTTYSYTLIPYNISGLQGKAVSVSLRTTSSSSGGGGGGGSSTSKSSSGGGGGGGAGSAEDFANVAMKDADSEYLRINSNVTYEFKKEGNPIQSVSFYSLKNSGEITSSIEVLNNRSKLVNSTPEGILYKYVNIWVGKSGFATAANIKDAKVRFNVQSSWINDMGLSPADVKLQRYNGAAWEVLPTNVESNTTDYVVFESQTSGFSPFAITAERQVVASIPTEAATTPIQKEEAVVQETQPEKTPGFGISITILMMGILAAGYAYVKRSQK